MSPININDLSPDDQADFLRKCESSQPAAPARPASEDLGPQPHRSPDVNHWGIWVNPEEPVTGVFTNNQAPEGFWDDVNDGINLTCDQCPAMHGQDPGQCDGCEPQGDILIGKWIKDPKDQKWAPDLTGDYAAIVGEIYTQVVFSKKTKRGALCSPCYPGQVDLETPGDFLGYCLPD